MSSKIKFVLPTKGVFQSNHEKDDPLPYYYKPITGYMYRTRIQLGLNLLSGGYNNVLEFGYGSGLLLPSLAGIADNLYGIDIVSEPEKVYPALNVLNVKAELTKGDITKVGYPSGFFDLIAGFSVFEHIQEPSAILAEMHRILKPSGKLLVGMPRVDNTMKSLFILIGYNNIDDHHVKNHKDFISDTKPYFILEKDNHMPGFLPEKTGLYFNMLFSKK